ncbi:MAG: putative virulence factor [Panacagrimonas sp.]
MNPTAPDLSRRWGEVFEGAGQAIAWVGSVSESAPRLAQEAPALIENLRRVRNRARRLRAAAVRPMTVGLFGLSQAGKSYLISAMAAAANGKLETVFDGQRLDFLQHINPPGGGSEATGLVTRFTRSSVEAPQGYPLKLTMISEAEIVKILGNTFFNDFDREKVISKTDSNHVLSVLRDLETRRLPKAAPGMSEDDVVDLHDYFELRFHKSMIPLKADYWPTAVRLAPYLAPKDRGRLFSVLWGEIAELTQAYLSLRAALEMLSFAETVYAPLDALVSRTGSGSFTQADSIMSVAILERLGSSADDRLEVCPWIDGAAGKLLQIPRALLTALTAEIAFPLVEPPVSPVFDSVDVLDFPGYRGRLALQSLDEVKTQVKRDDANPVTELILRGKVAYLFERYTDNQEMNVLIVCTPSDKQSEVTSVGPVLSSWIDATQGATAADRAKRPSGLVWAITMFDKTLVDSLQQPEDQLRIRWGDKGLMRRTLLERFGQYGWMSEWHPGSAFNRVFLVRKPGWKVSFLKLDQNRELAINDADAPQLRLMRKTFVEDPTVARHIDRPEQAWDAMLALNEGGIGHLASYLQTVADVRIKLDRLGEQLTATVGDIAGRWLGRFFQRDGADEVVRKQKLAEGLVAALRKRPALIGEMLSHFEPSTDDLRALYLRAEAEEESAPQAATSDASAPASDEFGFAAPDGLIDLGLGDFGDAAATPEAPTPAQPLTEVRFARAVMREWIKQLRDLPSDQRLMAFLGFAKKDVESLADEMIAGADRHKLEQRLVEATRRAERDASATRGRIVERQVLAVRTTICDFIAWLGNEATPVERRAASEAVKNRKLFEPMPDIAEGSLPVLPEQPFNYTALYLLDWMTALKNLIVGNAGHSATREISVEQNLALGRILERIAR